MKEDQQPVGFYIKVIQNTVENRINHFLREFDVTRPQMDILVYLAKAKSKGQNVSQKDLETFFHVSNPTISVMLSRLENKGLIERRQSEEDRRIRFIAITEKAESLTVWMKEALEKTKMQMYEGLSEEQIEQGLFFLKTILKNLIRKEEPCCAQNSDQTDGRVPERDDSDACSGRAGSPV